MINPQIQLLSQGRQNIQKICESYTIDQLNIIPNGFNNNLIWHFGHIIATFDLLVYKLSGLPLTLPEELYANYRKGTKPTGNATQAEFEKIVADSQEQLQRFVNDFEAINIAPYSEYPTSFGNTLTSAHDALNFLLIHEGIHLGYVLNIRRFLNQS